MPDTIHLNASVLADVEQAAELLRSGQLVAFATETVYGLGANALSAEAVAGIFAAKQRPAWDPLIVHLGSAEQLPGITVIPQQLAERVSALAERFWPGPLTLLLPRNGRLPEAVTAGREMVGVRVPAHPAAQALLARAALPIAAPSANTFGHTSPTTAQHVLADLDGRIAAVLDAGPTSIRPRIDGAGPHADADGAVPPWRSHPGAVDRGHGGGGDGLSTGRGAGDACLAAIARRRHSALCSARTAATGGALR